jgi:hypothetical protein
MEHHDHCHHEAGDSHDDTSRFKTAIHATFHCLTGCAIGEIIGLIVGVQLGFSPMNTMLLGTALAFIIGMSLAIKPVMTQQNLSLKQAFNAIWLGEVISIAVMELAMNGVDYWVGGVKAASIAEPIFWLGMAAAIPAGYIAALPVNYWLLSKELKKCH